MVVMTAGDMLGYTKRVVDIIKSEATDGIKNERLANLMSDLKQTYQIPSLIGNATNVDPIALEFYRFVSEERSW